jgi:hypothetical protein
MVQVCGGAGGIYLGKISSAAGAFYCWTVGRRPGDHAGERARARGTTRDESFFRSIQTSKSLATPAFLMPFKDCLDSLLIFF